MDIENERYVYCSFCRKHRTMVRWVIAGEGVFICDNCIDLCAEILKEHRDKEKNDG